MAAAVIFVMVTALPLNADPIVKQDERYKLVLTTKVTPDGKKEATIVVTPKPTYHNNMDYPWKVTLKSGPGVTPDTKYKKKKNPPDPTFKEEKVTFKIPTDNSTTEKVKAEIKMSHCNDKQCWSAKVALEW